MKTLTTVQCLINALAEDSTERLKTSDSNAFVSVIYDVENEALSACTKLQIMVTKGAIVRYYSDLRRDRVRFTDITLHKLTRQATSIFKADIQNYLASSKVTII